MLPNEAQGNVAREALAYHNPTSGYKWHTLEVPRRVPTVHSLRTGADATARIKVIEHPGVYLVGSMSLHEQAVNSYLSDHGVTAFSPWGEPQSADPSRNARGTDHELAVELSGRICYMSYEKPRPGGVQAFVDRLKSEGHGSVFEHPHYSFILSGVSRNMTLESNRHRTFNISQLSGRFVDAAEVGFVVDPDLMGNLTFRQEWGERCLAAFDSYEVTHGRKLMREIEKWQVKNPGVAKWSKEDERKATKRARERARDILPGCLETRVFYTVNARAARFIFEKRCHADAAFEIRRAFNGVYRLLKAHDPRLFSDYTEHPLDDGTFAVSTAWGKV